MLLMMASSSGPKGVRLSTPRGVNSACAPTPSARSASFFALRIAMRRLRSGSSTVATAGTTTYSSRMARTAARASMRRRLSARVIRSIRSATSAATIGSRSARSRSSASRAAADASSARALASRLAYPRASRSSSVAAACRFRRVIPPLVPTRHQRHRLVQRRVHGFTDHDVVHRAIESGVDRPRRRDHRVDIRDDG